MSFFLAAWAIASNTRSQAGEPTSDEAERVILAHSNIPTAEEVGPNPVFALNRDLIEKSGERETAELLRDLPFANANGVPVSNNANGSAPGAASVSLRGFSPDATLVLIDGRRIAPYPVSDGSGRAFQDLFSIQLSVVQSIEILKDGSSTTYGGGGLAGIINLKFWKDYRGTQVTLNYGNTLDKDAAIYQGDLLFGVGDDYVAVTGDIFFYHHDSLFNRDRGNSGTSPFLSANSSPFNLQLANAVVTAAGGTPASAGNPVGFGHAPFFTNGMAPASQYVYTQGRSSFFNIQQFNGSYPEQERYGGYAAFNDKICDDQLQIYGDFYYAKIKTNNERAPAGTGSFSTTGQPTIAIPPGSPLNGVAPPNTPRFAGEAGSGPFGSLAAGENPTRVPPEAFNPFNPFNQIISGGSRARLAEFGNRTEDDTSQAYVTTLGVKGDKLFDGNWGYDGGFRYSEIENDRSRQEVSASRFNRILNAADPIFDPASDQFIGTTIPYNPFGDYRLPIASNIPSINFATVHSKEIDVSKLTQLDLNIYNTELFKLPAGGVGVAFGGEFVRETIEQDPDRLELENDIISPIGVQPSTISHAGRKDYGFYGEIRVPLSSPEMGIPGLHSVEVTAAFRFEEFLANDSNVLMPKVGLRWQPFDEQLTIRSTWSEGYGEPSLFQLYGLPTFVVIPIRFNGVSEPGAVSVIDSNRNLQLEDSRTWTGGAAYTPKWFPWGAMTLWLDLWDIEQTGVVGAPSAQELLRRYSHGGPLLPGEDVQVDPATGFVTFIRTAFQNTGRQSARGADMAVLYQVLPPIGLLTLNSDWAYLDEFVLQRTSGTFGRNRIARAADQFSNEGWYRWKGLTRFDWAWHNFDLNATWRYVGGFREIIKNGLVNNPGFPNGVHEHWTNPTNFIDAQASYSLIFTPPQENDPVAGYSNAARGAIKSKDGKAVESTAAYSIGCWKTIINNSTFTIGCNNIFGQDPPKAFGFFFGNSINYPGFAYDNIGRFWYLEFKKKF